MGDIGDYWREHRDYQRKLKYYDEKACTYCSRVQSDAAPFCIKCGATNWWEGKE